MSAPSVQEAVEKAEKELLECDGYDAIPDILRELVRDVQLEALESVAKAGDCIGCTFGEPYYAPPDERLRAPRMWIHRHDGYPVQACATPSLWDLAARLRSEAGSGSEPAK